MAGLPIFLQTYKHEVLLILHLQTKRQTLFYTEKNSDKDPLVKFNWSLSPETSIFTPKDQTQPKLDPNKTMIIILP